MLPVVWTLFAVCAVAGFMTIAAYWLDVQDRSDMSRGARLAWSAATLLFPIAIPLYALRGDAGWPPFLRAASLTPAIGLALFFGFLFGLIR